MCEGDREEVRCEAERENPWAQELVDAGCPQAECVAFLDSANSRMIAVSRRSSKSLPAAPLRIVWISAVGGTGTGCCGIAGGFIRTIGDEVISPGR